MAKELKTDLMKISSGRVQKDDYRSSVQRGYITRCARSLLILLKENDEVEVRAVGTTAVANTLKTFIAVERMLKEENKSIKIYEPVYVDEKIDDREISVCSVKVTIA